MIPNLGRRKQDRLAYRSLLAITCLALASSLLAIYVSYRAIRAMDETERYAADAYHLGKQIGKQPSYAPIGPSDEQ